MKNRFTGCLLLFKKIAAPVFADKSLITAVLTLFVFSNFFNIVSAEEYFFKYLPSDVNTPQVNHRAGKTDLIEASYNSTTKNFLFKASFSASPETGVLPDAYFIVVNSGFKPKGRQGEMAVFYLDATDLAALKLTVYAYNGFNGGNSWQYGDMNLTLPSDKIVSSLNSTSWIKQLKAEGSSTGLTFTIEVDASIINSHTPVHGNPALWKGIEFGQYIGIWTAPSQGTVFQYGADGFIASRAIARQGYVNFTQEQTMGCDGIKGSLTQFDPCGVCGGDGSTCNFIPLNCSSRNVSNVLIDLDNQALRLKHIVINSSKDLYKLSGKSRKTRRQYLKFRQRALELYEKAWFSAWTYPQLIISCAESTTRCFQIPLKGILNAYLEHTKNLYKLSSNVQAALNRKGIMGRKIAARYKKSAQKAFLPATTVIKSLPDSISQCPG